MSSARVSTLATLRKALVHLETMGSPDAGRVALGHAEADAMLRGGLARAAMHEVFAEGRYSATATGFVAGLAQRVADHRAILWIRQDFAAREAGDLAMTGFAELGLDPRRIVVVLAKNAEMVLRIAADGVACRGVGVVIAEIWGETKAFDLVASRKLTLASSESGVTCLMLRLAASPRASTAETRWLISAAPSPKVAEWEAWGEPVFDVQLVRNRHGATGRWIMKWVCDECIFNELFLKQSPPHSQPLVAAPADRPDQAFVHPQRQTG